MQKIKDVLRLHLAGGVTSRRQLALVVGSGKSAVSDCLRRANVAGLTDWPAIAALDEGELEARLYPSQADSKLKGRRLRPAPDWAELRAELARRDHQVTLALLWQEYKAEQPDGCQYSQFCDLYRRFEKKLSVVLRQVHRGGEKTFVDFCDGMPLIDVKTGELIPTELFVGALGTSSYTFAHAALSQELPVWLDCHARMYAYFEGVSALTICDSLRSGVRHPDRYEAEVNATYRDFASHFGTCVLPRGGSPRRQSGALRCKPLQVEEGGVL